MTSLNTGAPHFKSVMKQHRHANYTLPKVLNEFIDNVIKKTNDIRISTQVDDTEKLQEVRVSDNYIYGFDNLDLEGVNNPFNMGHIKASHDDDAETSEFGVGMKAGALSAANQLNVYTRIKDSNGNHKYVEVICDFIRMSNETDVNASYNPRIKYISYEEYKEQHPFEYGSTLILSKIRDCIYSKTTHNEITTDLSNSIAETYSRFISCGRNIYVNNILLQPKYEFFEDSKCEPFTISKDLFILEKAGITLYLIRKTKEMSVWQEFNQDTSKWIKLKEHSDGLKYINELLKSGYRYVYAACNDEGACMQINTTFTFYSDKFHTRHKGSEPELPEDCVYIYKDDRNYGRQSLLKHNNGIHNYTLHEIDFVSKKLGKDLGITFNKEILMNGTNDLIVSIKAALVDSREDFSADTSVKKNTDLCEKAIKKGLIDLMTCPETKLSAHHRSLRIEASSKSGSKLPSVVSIKPNKSISKHNVVPQIPSVNPNIISDIDIDQTSHNTSSVTDSVTDSVSDSVSELSVNLEDDIIFTPHNSPNNIPNIITDIYEHIETNDPIENIEDIEDRKRRTIIIMDYLQKSISGLNDDVLSDQVLSIIEGIFK